MLDTDTIVAIATPPGRGGIGVVRVSGSRALEVTAPLVRLRAGLEHGRARFGHVVTGEGEVLDEAVVTYFAAPRSYTSEDVVEIAAHGAPVLLEWLVRGALAGGARLAEPGEFTARAFLSGRLDLTQAEAVHDLVAAQTLHQAKLAAAQLGGAIAAAVRPWRQALLELIAGLEAGVDFAEDDLDLMAESEVQARLEALLAGVRGLAATYAYGRLVRDGVRLAIVGRPNAGKSSLFNRLLERERAIVTAQPGTTRDPIVERVAIGGIPVELVDTAGLREVADGVEHEAEREGISRSRMALAEADLVLHVVDASAGAGLSEEDTALRAEYVGRAGLLVWNKSDLVSEGGGIVEGVSCSAKTGDGIDGLRREILGLLGGRPSGDGALITNLRQAEALGGVVRGLEKALTGSRGGVPHEFLLMDLHEGLGCLDGLTGAGGSEEVLGLIFSRFCIGK